MPTGMGIGEQAFDGTDGPEGFGVLEEPPGLRFDMETDLLCTAGADGYFKSLNAAWERVLGWSREELMARPYIEFVHPDDVARTAAAGARITEVDHELVGFDNRFRTKDGGYRWLRWSSRTDGETWFSIAFDITHRKHAEDELRAAIKQDRLLAYSQPIIDQRSGTVVQEELLVRLRTDGGGLTHRVLAPADFLPQAERSGLIRNIDLWMTMRALELAAHGRNVEVNLSGATIADAGVMAELAGRLGDAGVTARRLVFEITETAAFENVDAAHDLAEQLGRLGCLIALDDFGTGFGSLTHLRKLPIHMIKIDASFVRGIRDHSEDQALVRGVTTIARELGMQTVAEGVEDATTFGLLREYGVDRIQGFLIGRPAPVAA
jgi:PAS domain S-box-containing protein